MSTSRKRYRPLDAAEERAVNVHERIQLTLLEDEQSYCFSWPEVPLTQWLQEDIPYATLYQLYANAAIGASSGASSHTMRGQGGALGDAGATSSAPDFPQGKSRVATSTPSCRRDACDVSAPAGTMTAQGVIRHQRSIEVPPVFLLDDFKPPSARHAPASMASGSDRPAGDAQGYSSDAACLVRRVRDAINSLQHIPISPSSEANSEVIEVKDGVLSSTTPSPAIVVKSDAAARAVPHPLAPPRPQSITEDSIFSLSATQLADLEAAAVPVLYASAIRVDAQGSLQHAQSSATSTGISPHDPSAKGVGVAFSSADVRGRRRGLELTEAARREMESEIVGLEWRTWLQSQRTASALQRLLSLEAAVPFEDSCDTQRDAWRAVVYRLWLQWRQHRPLSVSGREATRESVASIPGMSAGSVEASAVPSANRASHGVSALVSPLVATATVGTPKGLMLSHTKSHLPWGAPLLPGAYLYGTSNDYFVGLPPSATGPSSTAGKGGCGKGNGNNGGGGLSSNSAITTPFWPAMSRRRGTYHFLRWRVELHEAQFSQTRSAAEEGNEEDEEEEEARVGDRYGTVEGGMADGSGRMLAGNAQRCSKGVLRGIEADASAWRRGASRTVGDGGGVSVGFASPPRGRRTTPASGSVSSTNHTAISGVMSAAHIKALVHTTVLTRLLTEVEMDDEPTTVMERLACTDLRRDTAAWRVWLSRV